MKLKTLLTTTAVIAATASAVCAIEPGEMAPEFKLMNTSGEPVSLSDYKGKTVVLEWFNYDCPFVKKHYQSGNLPELQESYIDKGVVWLAINSSAEGKQGYYAPADQQKRSDKEGSKASEILLDTDGTVGKAYDAKTTPQMVVINGEGKVIYAGAIDDKPTTELADIDAATNYVSAALDAAMEGKEIEQAKTKPYGCGVKY